MTKTVLLSDIPYMEEMSSFHSSVSIVMEPDFGPRKANFFSCATQEHRYHLITPFSQSIVQPAAPRPIPSSRFVLVLQRLAKQAVSNAAGCSNLKGFHVHS